MITHEIIVLILIVIILIMAVDLVVVNLISRFYCDSKCPELPAWITQKMIFGKVTKRKSKKSKQRASELESMGLEVYKLKADDGAVLVAHYYPCNNADRIVIACHGWKSSWSHDFNAQTEFLHNNGCSILYIEQRGHGESGGRYIYHGKMERFDIAKWSCFVEQNISRDLPIYLYGMSMGAAASLMALGSDVSKNVKGVIADSASSNVKFIMKQSIRNLNLPLAIFYPQIKIDQYLRIKMAADAYTAEMALENSDTSVLFIHGRADAVASPEVAQHLYQICRGDSKMLLLIDNANHMKSYFINKEKYESTLIDFFNKTEKL